MATGWYYKAGGAEIGPVSSGGLRQRVLGGEIRPDTLVREGPAGDWLPAKSVSGLFAPEDAKPFDAYHTWLGIPPEEQPPNHYRLLGIRPFEDDPDVIENAADRQMSHLRARQTGRHSVLSQVLLNAIAAAKICLLSPQKKAAYDRQLRQRLAPEAVERKAAIPAVLSRRGGLIGMLAVLAVAGVGIIVLMEKLAGKPNADLALPDKPVRSLAQPDFQRPLPDPLPERETPGRQQPGEQPAGAGPSRDQDVGGELPGPEPLAQDSSGPPGRPEPAGQPSAAPPPGDPSPDGRPPAAEPRREETKPEGKPAEKTPEKGVSKDEAGPEKVAVEVEQERQNEERRLARMQEIFEKQLDLYKRQKNTQSELQPIEAELESLGTNLAGLLAARKAVEAQATAIRLSLPPDFNPAASPQLAACRAQLVQIDMNSRQVNMKIASNMALAQNVQAKMARLVQESDLYGREWLSLCDPFGKWGPEVHRRGLPQLEKWINEEDQLPLPYLARGLSHIHLGKYELASADFDRVVELDRRTLPLVTGVRGYMLGKQGQNEKAQAQFAAAEDLLRTAKRESAAQGRDPVTRQEAAQLDKILGLVYVFRGYGCVEQGDPSGAEKWFGIAARPAYESPDAHQALGWLYATCPRERIRNPKKALSHAEKAGKLVKDGPWYYADTLGAAHAAAGDFASAVQWATKAAELAPSEQRPTVDERISLYRSRRPYRAE